MDNDEIERLKKRLYRKGETFREREIRSPLTPTSQKAKTYWEEASPEEGRLSFPEQPKSTLVKKLVIAAVVVVSLAIAGIVAYFLAGGMSVVSSSNIDISLGGPTSIKGGESGNWQVAITNKNKTNLELADLIIDYPEGARPISGAVSGTKAFSERRSIGQIGAGQTVTEAIGAYLFGEKDTDQVFKFTLEYRPQGSNAILAKTAEQSVHLLQSPVEVSINLPDRIKLGRRDYCGDKDYLKCPNHNKRFDAENGLSIRFSISVIRI